MAAGAASPAAFVDAVIREHKVVVFSKTWCGYCSKAKRVLSGYACSPFVVELDTRDDGDAIQAALASKTGRRTVPNVIIGGRSIGGGDDTEALHREGKLAGLLRAAGALRE